MDKIKKIIKNKYFIFIVAFLIMYVYLFDYTIDTFCEGSMDSYETVNVIKTLFSNIKHYSYVMYKGIYAFIPGYLCNLLSLLFKLDEAFFIKIFNSLSFAYISSIGLPYLLSFILKKEIKYWQRYLLILLFFILEGNVFSFISVDFYSLILLVLSVNNVIKIEKNTFKFWGFIYSGFIIGVSSCLSGQYFVSSILLIIYIFYKIIYLNKRKLKKIILLVILVFFGFFVSRGINTIYNTTVVNPAREKGEWIPSGSDWLHNGFTRDMFIINYPKELNDGLGEKIVKNEKMNVEIIKNGGTLYDTKGMIKVISKYPSIFIARWLERLFLGLGNDQANAFPKMVIPFDSIIMILIMYTFVFVSFMNIKVKKIKDILNLRTIIILTFILSAMAACLFHVENRYFIAIRSLIIGIFCFSDLLKNTMNRIKRFIKTKEYKNILNIKINKVFINYVFYMILVMLLYTALYQ